MIPAGVAIRRALPRHAPALSDLAIRSKVYWGYDEAFLAACRDELTLRVTDIAEHPTAVAVIGERLLGFYRLVIGTQCADVAMFFVAPEAIGRGLGRLLWRHLEAEARRRGVAAITIDSDPHAEGFYVLMGAVRMGESPSGSVCGRSLPHLVKRLSIARW